MSITTKNKSFFLIYLIKNLGYLTKFRKEVKDKFEAQNVLWLSNQKSLRRKHYAAIHVWQGDPFHKDVHKADEVIMTVPRSKPAGGLSNLGPKDWKKEINFQINENNLRSFIFGRLTKAKTSVGKKIRKDCALKKDIEAKMEIWDFIEEVMKLTIIELLEWDWENPDFNIFLKCYNRTLSKFKTLI